MLGYSYSSNGYKCLALDGTIYISKNLLFTESKFPYPTLFPSKSSTSTDPQPNPTSFTIVPIIPISVGAQHSQLSTASIEQQQTYIET